MHIADPWEKTKEMGEDDEKQSYRKVKEKEEDKKENYRIHWNTRKREREEEERGFW